MGVPAFFRWLTVRYPQVVVDALCEQDLEYYYTEYQQGERGGKDGKRLQDVNEVDLMGGGEADRNLRDQKGEIDPQILIQRKIEENNPSVDNLYLDMNGIIHPCCHPLDRPAPRSETEMFNLIFEYTDKVINIVRPKRTLYLAIDGVAPRAKMNQQRSRRFRTAIDAEEKAEREANIKNKWAEEGIKFADRPQQTGDQAFDSNVITPGTEFMYNLSKALQLYIVERLHSSDKWDNLKVIFSDASVPGEGEHKILDFIRSQRAQMSYDPNTSHCIYGADADLIMLGLSTHEPHFFILRESIAQEKDKKCRRCHKMGHLSHECGNEDLKDPNKVKQAQAVQFQFVKIAVVREYLYLEFKDIKLPRGFDFDLERIVDDFVFLCFFVGNDFLPHLPSLSIREGALDALIFIYKNLLPSLGGYLTNTSGGLNFSEIDVLLDDLARVEEEFFKQHQRNAERNEERRKRDEQRDNAKNPMLKQLQEQQQKAEAQGKAGNGEQVAQPVMWRNVDKRATSGAAGEGQEAAGRATGNSDKDLMSLEDKEILKQMTAAQLEEHGKSYVQDIIMSKKDLTEEEKMEQAKKKLTDIVKKQMHEKQDKLVEAYEDRIQFTKEGWKARYYSEKFHVRGAAETKEFCKNIRQAYIEGLAWVYAYYYRGCVSWYWYYPYHYAPFASDLQGCDQLAMPFNVSDQAVEGEPAKPFEQLLAVFPIQSSHAIPECYRKLYDADSEIIDFYPTDVKLDINGARYAWMGVNLLPFLDRERLKFAMNKADDGESKLTQHEKEKNRVSGDIRLFFLESGRLKESAIQLALLEQEQRSSSKEIKQDKAAAASSMVLDASFARQDGIAGQVEVLVDPRTAGSKSNRPLAHGLPIKKSCGQLELELDSCRSFLVHFKHPKYERHLVRLLKGATLARREVEDFAIYHTNRRVFQGEEAIRIVERVLNIDASQDPVYQFGGRQNRSGQEFGGYRNNHAVDASGTGVQAGGFQALPQLGQRRTYQEYQQMQQQPNRGGGYRGDQYERGPGKRPNYGYSHQDYQGNHAGYNQQHQPVNFNLHGRGGAGQNQGSRIQENYARQIQQVQQTGGNNQLASLLGQFNDSHKTAPQNANNVLVQPPRAEHRFAAQSQQHQDPANQGAGGQNSQYQQNNSSNYPGQHNQQNSYQQSQRHFGGDGRGAWRGGQHSGSDYRQNYDRNNASGGGQHRGGYQGHQGRGGRGSSHPQHRY